MRLNLNFDVNLIQQIRLLHSISDYGYEILMDKSNFDKLLPLYKKFNLNFSIGRNEEYINLSDVISINHSKPETSFNGQVKRLIFAPSLIDFCKNLWLDERSDKIFFNGLITPSRKKSMDIVKNMYGNDIEFNDSKNGRTFPLKSFDEEYFIRMSKYKFIFCPNGDFVWSYRFIETVMCGGIPIVETKCDLFDGFRYYTLNESNEKLIYDINIVNHNIQHLINNFTLTNLEVRPEQDWDKLKGRTIS